MTLPSRAAAVIVVAALAAAHGDLLAHFAGSPALEPNQGSRPAIAGVGGPIGSTVAEVPATPWVGAPGQVRTTAEIMAVAQRKLASAVEAATMADLLPLDLTVGAPNVTLLSHGPNPEPDTNAVPPDPSGDIGPSQYLLAVNGRIRSYAKATGAADGEIDVTTDQFFQTVRDGAATAKPRVRYDRKAGRWIVTMITRALPNRFLVAVSDTATVTQAASTWRFFQWTNTRTAGGLGAGASCLGDDPTLGFDDLAYYIGVNQRCGAAPATANFDSTSVLVVRRNSLLSNNTLVVSQLDAFVATPGGGGIFAPQGVVNFDANPTYGYVIGVDNVEKGRLVLRRISNAGASPMPSSDFVITQEIDPTGDPIPVPRQGGTVPLDGLDDRLSQAVIRNGRLWTSHHFAVNSLGEVGPGLARNGIRWYELANLTTTLPSLVQSGTVWDSAGSSPAHYWLGALMLNGQGHVALGMSAAGALRRVNAAVTGRLAGDPAETMQAPELYTNTISTYNLQDPPATVQAWGGSSSTSIDPDDDMTMWTLQQFVDAADSYGLRLVRIQAPAPAVITSLSPNMLANGLIGATVTVDALGTGGTGFFDPGAGFARRIAAAFSGLGVTVTDVSVVTPTRLRLTVNTTGALPGARTLTVTNPDGQTRQLTSALTIVSSGSLNLPPVANNDGGSTRFGTLLNVPAPGVLANDVDPESQPLTAQLVTTTASGALTLSANGALIYVPNPGFSGTDTFTYRAFDGTHQSNVATVTIAVGVNAAPVFGATPGNVTLYQAGTPISSGPLPFSVVDPDGNPLVVTATSSNTAVVPAAGVILGGAGSNRTVTVITPGGVVGSSTITLTASDGTLTAVASFTVTVLASTVPGAPQNFMATVSRNTVVFTWQPPASPSGEPVQTYVLDVGVTPGVTLFSLPVGNVLSFSATAPDAVYYVRLRAVTPAGSGPQTSDALVQLGQTAVPFPPLALLATVQGSGVTLQWTENPLGPVVGSYQLQAGTATGLVDIGVIPLPASARSLAVNAPTGTYFVRLVAVNAAGSSPPSNEAILMPGPGACTPPAAPTGLVASSSGGVISVAWSPAAAGAIPLNYVVEAGTVSGAANLGTFALPASATTIGGPVPAGPYFIRVRAANACGASGPSAEVSATVQ
jgi:hypothetical protein